MQKKNYLALLEAQVIKEMELDRAIANLITFFAEKTKDTHMVERVLSESMAFKGRVLPLKSQLLQSAINEVRYARMFGGDCIRMIVNRELPRSNVRFDPAAHDAVYNDDLHKLIANGDELALVQDLKAILRDTLYALFDDTQPVLGSSISLLTTNQYSEYCFYLEQFKVHLKKADQNLGLRLGEIHASKVNKVQ